MSGRKEDRKKTFEHTLSEIKKGGSPSIVEMNTFEQLCILCSNLTYTKSIDKLQPNVDEMVAYMATTSYGGFFLRVCGSDKQSVDVVRKQ